MLDNKDSAETKGIGAVTVTDEAETDVGAMLPPLLPAAGTPAFRTMILVTLTFTTSTTVLLLRTSRREGAGEGERSKYLPSTVVFLTECVKVAICTAALFNNRGKRSLHACYENLLPYNSFPRG